MFRSLSVLVIIGIFISCTGKSSTADKPVEELMDTAYTISGIAKGAPDSTVIVLQFIGVEMEPDTTYVKGEKFEFKGVATDPVVAAIFVLEESHDLPKALRIIVENSVINIEGENGNFHLANVIGGIRNNDFNDLKKALVIYEDSIDVLMMQAAEAEVDGDTTLLAKLQYNYSSTEKEKATILKQYVFEHPKSIGAAFFVITESSYSTAEIDSLYNNFDSSILQNAYVKQIKNLVDAGKRTAIGQQAPDFELPNLNGKSTSLSSLKNKYVFVDFWASWCGPCRTQNPGIVAAYKKYKGKEFDILSVSLDDDRLAWKEAIKQDKLTWQHVSDLKGWESSVVPVYGIRSLPATILLDKAGKIIASGINPTQLEEKLAEVLKLKL